jgi:hypothetical protein
VEGHHHRRHHEERRRRCTLNSLATSPPTFCDVQFLYTDVIGDRSRRHGVGSRRETGEEVWGVTMLQSIYTDRLSDEVLAVSAVVD